jgi:condensin complex subunit 3
MVQRDKKNVVIEAFKSIINCIMAYSLNKLVGLGKNEQDAERRTTEAITKITSVMTSLLDDQVTLAFSFPLIEIHKYSTNFKSSEIYTMAVEGFCKLFMTGHLLSAKLFSKLLIMYYSPLTENDKKLRSCLAYFLPQFSFLRRYSGELKRSLQFPSFRTIRVFQAQISFALNSRL